MKKLKKNHWITPTLITLTGLVVAIGTYTVLRLPSPKPEPQPTRQPTMQPNSVKPAMKTDYCHRESFENKPYIVCRANPAKDDIELFLNDRDNKPYKYFRNVEKMLQTKGKTLAFAMNAGMYHKDYGAVGLYIENGKEIHGLSTKEGPGNFHMKPNGVFYIKDKKAVVIDTDSYAKADLSPDLATQSGPMLVINNQIHPRFIPNSPYLEYRNGIGVKDDGNVVFVISETKVNFDEMARFFRDQLHTPNALFLDGSISSLYAPEFNRYDWWYGLGPILGVIIDQPASKTALK